MDLVLDGVGVHDNQLSSVFELTPQDTFVIGLSGKRNLDALALYRVHPDGSLVPAFWYEMYNMKQSNLTLSQFIDNALKYFTGSVQRYFDDTVEPDDIYDKLANALTTIKWDASERKFHN